MEDNLSSLRIGQSCQVNQVVVVKIERVRPVSAGVGACTPLGHRSTDTTTSVSSLGKENNQMRAACGKVGSLRRDSTVKRQKFVSKYKVKRTRTGHRLSSGSPVMRTVYGIS